MSETTGLVPWQPPRLLQSFDAETEVAERQATRVSRRLGEFRERLSALDQLVRDAEFDIEELPETLRRLRVNYAFEVAEVARKAAAPSLPVARSHGGLGPTASTFDEILNRVLQFGPGRVITAEYFEECAALLMLAAAQLRVAAEAHPGNVTFSLRDGSANRFVAEFADLVFALGGKLPEEPDPVPHAFIDGGGAE